MKDSFQFEPVWNGLNFSVTRAILDPDDVLSSPHLGPSSVVVIPGTEKLTHRISGNVIAGEPVIAITGPSLRRLWTEGDITEIVNQALKPVEVFQISMKYDPELQSHTSDLSLAAIDFLHGDLDDRFKASVQADLDSIAILGERFAQGSTPVSDDLQRAEWARQDLEIKLKWYSSGRDKTTFSPVLNIPITETFAAGFVNFAFHLPGFPGKPSPPGKGTSAGPGKSKGMVTVTVNTKDAAGSGSAGWRVMSDAQAHGPYKGTAQPFGQLSTPTTDLLPLGLSCIWGEKGTVKGTSMVFNIGNGSVLQQTIDVTVP